MKEEIVLLPYFMGEAVLHIGIPPQDGIPQTNLFATKLFLSFVY